MGRRNNELEPTRFSSMVLLSVGLISCALVYACVSLVLRTSGNSSVLDLGSLALDGDVGDGGGLGGESGRCCRGIDNLELWGAAVKWGSDFKFNSSEECCNACKKMCTGNDGPCLCNTWVFCGNREACGPKFGEVS